MEEGAFTFGRGAGFMEEVAFVVGLGGWSDLDRFMKIRDEGQESVDMLDQ